MKCLRGLEIKSFADLSSAFLLLSQHGRAAFPQEQGGMEEMWEKPQKWAEFLSRLNVASASPPPLRPQMQLVGNPKILSWEPKNPEAARPGCGTAWGGRRAGKEWGKGVLKWFDFSLLFSWQ